MRWKVLFEFLLLIVICVTIIVSVLLGVLAAFRWVVPG